MNLKDQNFIILRSLIYNPTVCYGEKDHRMISYQKSIIKDPKIQNYKDETLSMEENKENLKFKKY